MSRDDLVELLEHYMEEAFIVKNKEALHRFAVLLADLNIHKGAFDPQLYTIGYENKEPY